MRRKNILNIITLSAALCATQINALRGTPPKEVVTITHTTNYPEHLDFLPEMVKLLNVPHGYTVAIAASGLGKPRMLYHTSDGKLYITRRDTGDVLLLKDTNNDGKFDELKTVVAEFKGVHGITLRDNMLYLCNNNELRRYKINADGMLSQKEMLFNDMPSAGQHPNRTMDWGPDGKLYISIGTLCNDCKESDKEAATLIQVDPVTWKRKIFASGLRNMIGFDWHPQTKELWGVDNGGDAKGDDWPPEELNLIQEGKNYGYPFAYAKKQLDETREDPAGNSKNEWVKTTEASVMEFQAHMAPIAYKFFPIGTINSGSALVAWHGSWNRSKPVGFKVQKINFVNGRPTGAEDFLTGFLKGKTRFGRPAGIAISPSGTVYVSDDANGVLYSITKNKNL